MNQSTMRYSIVRIVLCPASDGPSHIEAHTPQGLQLWEKHLDTKKMQEVDHFLDQLVSYFMNN